jgi:hypothetical protein
MISVDHDDDHTDWPPRKSPATAKPSSGLARSPDASGIPPLDRNASLAPGQGRADVLDSGPPPSLVMVAMGQRQHLGNWQ